MKEKFLEGINTKTSKLFVIPNSLDINKNVYFTVHLMIYDIKGHVEHVIKSPFTCFDWERKNISIGLKCSKLWINTYLNTKLLISLSIVNKYFVYPL